MAGSLPKTFQDLDTGLYHDANAATADTSRELFAGHVERLDPIARSSLPFAPEHPANAE